MARPSRTRTSRRDSERSPLLPAASRERSLSAVSTTSSHKSDRDRDRDQYATFLLRSLVALLFALFFLLLLLLLLFLLPLSSRGRSPTSSASPQLDHRGRLNPAHLARGPHGAVAAENGVCSAVGVDLLKAGGSAADAAVGAALCVGTLNMFSSGIGGGGFALVRAPVGNGSGTDAEHVTVDFRETAPAAATAEMFHASPRLSQVGGLAVGVPGELRGLEEIWRRWGKLPWADVVLPSARLADEARVGRELARRLRYFGSFIPEKPEWQAVFMDARTGRFLDEGDTIRRTAYAETLRQVAQRGSHAFYSGDVAASIVEKVQAAGGILTLQDLRDYRIEVRPALQGVWTRARRAWTTPAPTSGAVLLEMMNVLRLLGFEAYARADTTDAPLDALWQHRLVETMKHGFASRTRLGDPAFLDTSALLDVARIPTLARARAVLAAIDDGRTFPLEHYAPLYDVPSDHGTTHISAVDSAGMAVGITSTVNLIFGAQEMDARTGVIFNDEMDDTSTPGVPNAFGLRPSPLNYPAPHKRPLSSITPLLIEAPSGEVQLLLGGAGGSRIPTSVLQALLNLERGMNLSEAVEHPRIHHQLLPDQVAVETTLRDGEDPRIAEVRRGLRQRGHKLAETDVNVGFAVVQAVQVGWDALTGDRTVEAASDSRKNGWAEAY